MQGQGKHRGAGQGGVAGAIMAASFDWCSGGQARGRD